VTRGRVMVIGLDGATFTLLKPWMEEGYLPFLNSLMNHGVHGPLQSSIPPVTSPAWQCFMTGKNPGKHGVVWFFEERPDTGVQVLVNATSCEGKTLWELLSEDGKRVAVLNVPFSFPPPNFNGVMIGGFDTPPSRRDQFVYPPKLLEEIEARFGPYQVDLNRAPLLLIGQGYEVAIEAFLKNCQELTDYQFKVAQYVYERDEFDFFMFYQRLPDLIQHSLWYLLDAQHPRHDAELARRMREPILGYYTQLDAQIKRLVERAGDEATVIVISDHGFGPMTKIFDPSSWLLKEGYIKIKRHPFSQLKYLLWKLGWGPKSLQPAVVSLCLRLMRRQFFRQRVQRALSRKLATRGWTRSRPFDPADIRARAQRTVNRLFLSGQDIDWSRTKAQAQAGAGLFRLNLVGREPYGAVTVDDYNTVRDEIIAKLRQLIDPSTGRQVSGQVFSQEQVYHGKYADRMPDIVFVSEGDCIVLSRVIFATPKIVFADDPGPTGFHRSDGVLIARGPALKQGYNLEGASIMDLAPTILYLMDSRVPDDVDGRVLTALFDEGFLQTHPILYQQASPGVQRQLMELDQADQAAILDRLKGLGYVD
jgi:predicted AlkP superfamily phosphohydrolase/phosphomutase